MERGAVKGTKGVLVMRPPGRPGAEMSRSCWSVDLFVLDSMVSEVDALHNDAEQQGITHLEGWRLKHDGPMVGCHRHGGGSQLRRYL
jgi:hypothetical protein